MGIAKEVLIRILDYPEVKERLELYVHEINRLKKAYAIMQKRAEEAEAKLDAIDEILYDVVIEEE